LHGKYLDEIKKKEEGRTTDKKVGKIFQIKTKHFTIYPKREKRYQQGL
jgi:hypothetical protein